jgi:hypothetical protein
MLNNTQGNTNSAVGLSALRSNTTGSNNTGMGVDVLYNNTTGFSNTAVGRSAGFGNTVGVYNVSLGAAAGLNTTSGSRNVAVGYSALDGFSFANGDVAWNSDNVAVGYDALGSLNATANTNALNNVALGASAGNSITTGSNNTLLGFGTDLGTATLNYATAIGSGATVNCSNCFSLGGNTAAAYTRVGINENAPSDMLHIKQYSTYDALLMENDANTNNWGFNIGVADLQLYYNNTYIGYFDDVTGGYTAVSDKRYKKNISYMNTPLLAKVMQLKPAFYQLNHAKETDQRNIGFIAQEVQEVLPEAVRETDEGMLSINYDDFGVIAIKAIQEQQQIIEEQKGQIDELWKYIKEMEKKLQK